MQRWLATAKVPDGVYRLMKLGKPKRNNRVVNSPEFAVWATADLFNIAKDVIRTRRIATRLLETLLTAWLIVRTSPDDVLDELERGMKLVIIGGARINTPGESAAQ
ncbi:hypothetical protein ON010_g17561 [Phytophthora cinnamomi]|nr:hypothetical protein ON010_g17561 [Phytophthora cinnamomi]